VEVPTDVSLAKLKNEEKEMEKKLMFIEGLL